MRARMSERTGAAIRRLRLAKGWTLATLSEETAIPLSTLSRVELGQNALNYDKLVRLCRALDVDLESLVTREAEASVPPSGRRSVTRAGVGASVRLGHAAGLAAAADLLAKGFSPTILDVTAKDLAAHGPMAAHPGEAYALALSGPVELHSRHYAPLSLAVGDAVYFDAAAGYALVAPQGRAKVLLVAQGEPGFDAA
jgi:transcriptional regulator with XRE-family HTH domain